MATLLAVRVQKITKKSTFIRINGDSWWHKWMLEQNQFISFNSWRTMCWSLSWRFRCNANPSLEISCFGRSANPKILMKPIFKTIISEISARTATYVLDEVQFFYFNSYSTMRWVSACFDFTNLYKWTFYLKSFYDITQRNFICFEKPQAFVIMRSFHVN